MTTDASAKYFRHIFIDHHGLVTGVHWAARQYFPKYRRDAVRIAISNLDTILKGGITSYEKTVVGGDYPVIPGVREDYVALGYKCEGLLQKPDWQRLLTSHEHNVIGAYWYWVPMDQMDPDGIKRDVVFLTANGKLNTCYAWSFREMLSSYLRSKTTRTILASFGPASSDYQSSHPTSRRLLEMVKASKHGEFLNLTPYTRSLVYFEGEPPPSL